MACLLPIRPNAWTRPPRRRLASRWTLDRLALAGESLTRARRLVPAGVTCDLAFLRRWIISSKLLCDLVTLFGISESNGN